MSTAPGSLVWYELVTTDADSASDFYAHAVGWTVRPSGMPGADYRLLAAPDGSMVGGLLQPPADHAGPVRWRPYVEVADVDAAVAAATQEGGAVHLPPMDVPDVGRIAMLADPQDATFYVIASTGDTSDAFRHPGHAAPGHAVWQDLAAPDPAAAIAFYTGLLGWRQEGAMPMGPDAAYSFIHDAAGPIGAIMPVMWGAEPGWRCYFHVDDIDAAAKRIEEAGGSVPQAAVEIPGGEFALLGADRQGGLFGLVGPRRERDDG